MKEIVKYTRKETTYSEVADCVCGINCTGRLYGGSVNGISMWDWCGDWLKYIGEEDTPTNNYEVEYTDSDGVKWIAWHWFFSDNKECPYFGVLWMDNDNRYDVRFGVIGGGYERDHGYFVEWDELVAALQ